MEEMVGHLMWLISINQIEVNRSFIFSTLLMFIDATPKSMDLTQGVDPKLRLDLIHDFKLC
jgi:hypothetical protein